jgi:3-deoxy-D-manno-octulosonic-acid transferase
MWLLRQRLSTDTRQPVQCCAVYLLYSAVLFLVALISAPWWLVQMARLGKYRAGLPERLGRVPNRLAHNAAGPVIWIHAVSVGEALAISELVSRLCGRFPSARVLISTTTQTGQKLAAERFGVENVFYFPLDFAFAIRPYLRRLKPDVIVLAETEFWPNFIRLANSSGAKIIVTNARISDRSFPRYRRFAALMRPVLRNIDAFLTQSKTDAERLVEIGALEDRVFVAGNLKFEVKPPNTSTGFVLDLAKVLERMSIAPVIVAGSTVEGEEPIVLNAFRALLQAFPTSLLILAPRHRERFESIASLLETSGIPFVRRSKVSGDFAEFKPGSVLLLDSIGELAAIYSLADIAFVGGSLVPRGGHNILEPAYFGKAIVVGPHTENFRDIVSYFTAEDAVLICEPEELGDRWLALLREPGVRKQFGERARAVFKQRSGATDRTVDAIAERINR